MSKRNLFLKIILPILILALGLGGMRLMIKQRQAPAKQPPPFRGLLVETVGLTRTDYPLRIEATGTVQPRREAEIVPQVSGKVVKVAPNLVAGRFFRKGELLFSLEAIDYQLAVERAEANLSRFELDLERVRAQAEIGRAEWRQLHPEEEPNPLVVFAPQLKNAQAALASARLNLRQARLDLARTAVVAPFNGFVRSESIALGQYLRAGNPVARMAGSDRAEILVPISLDDLAWLDVPRRPGKKGSTAEISLTVAGKQWHWSGSVDRALAEVDPRGRMAQVAVVVEDPYGRKEAGSARPRLAIGSYVSLRLQGELLKQVVALPRRALHEGNRVWVMDADNRLQIRSVEVVRREREQVLVSAGLDGSEQVVVTPISGAANGLLLRTVED